MKQDTSNTQTPNQQPRKYCPNSSRLITIFSLCLTLLLANTAAAESITVQSAPTITPVVELYTSQGCSSCPPADAWISKLGNIQSADFHAIPLAFHVDYWNYLGWQDPYSNPKFTKRQRALAANNKQRTIYTPEFLVSGVETRGTSAVVKAIQQANQQPAKVQINLTLKTLDNGELQAKLKINNQANAANLYLAISENNLTSEISAGENHGKILANDHVVRYFNKAAILQTGEYQNTHTLKLSPDWKTNHLVLIVIVASLDNQQTYQALATNLNEMY